MHQFYDQYEDEQQHQHNNWLQGSSDYEYYMPSDCSRRSTSCGEGAENEDERLASLEALRQVLHHAPFCQDMHNLMSVPDECSLTQQGIPTKCAIRVESLSYRHILRSVRMEVPQGKIYALLGAPNAGKTTLLRCILGRITPSSGTITTFGNMYRAKGSNLAPLSAICVGYMPQQVSLYDELSVRETLLHYARLYQLPIGSTNERISTLAGMLHLSKLDYPVRQLNATQKWQVSLAVALIHSPPLLLLDEPTVMLDPLIRCSVWKRLAALCDQEGLTVLLTTDYPEEIGRAYKVGLMRDGHIFREDRPDDLRKRYSCDTFEQMFCNFCLIGARRISLAPQSSPSHSNEQTINGKQMIGSIFGRSLSDRTDVSSSGRFDRRSSSMCADLFRTPLPMADWPICERRRTAYLTRFINLDYKRLLTLILKNFYLIRANLLPIIIFYLILPALHIILTCAIFGRSVHQLPVSVPLSDASSDDTSVEFSRVFVDSFLDRKVFTPVYAKSVQQAVAAVRSGKAWAAILPCNSSATVAFSSSSQAVAEDSFATLSRTNSSLARSNKCAHVMNSSSSCAIKLHLDQSNYMIFQAMFYSLISSMSNYLVSQDVSFNPDACSPQSAELAGQHRASMAFSIEQVLFGSVKFRFLEFLLPGFLCLLIFAFSLVLSAYFFMKEQLSGAQERCLVAGTSGVEVLAAHFISQTSLYVAQKSVLLLIVLRLFALQWRRPFFASCLLLFLQGLLGISFGILVAVILPRPIVAALITSAIFIPVFFCSGIIWPIESMHRYLQLFSHALPLTLPINSLRSLIWRGPNMHYARTALGFVFSTGYIALVLILALVIFKYKTSS